jgi:hypothetical protein
MKVIPHSWVLEEIIAVQVVRKCLYCAQKSSPVVTG